MSKPSRRLIALTFFGLLRYPAAPAVADVVCATQSDCDAAQYCNSPWPQCTCIEWHNKVQNPSDTHLCWPVNEALPQGATIVPK